MDPSVATDGARFERYLEAKGNRARLEKPDLRVRLATLGDIAAASTIAALRSGEPDASHRPSMEARIADANRRLFVAEHAGGVIGFGKCRWMDRTDDAGPGIPQSWYLAGLVVHPDYRRRGVGLGLTKVRIAWLFERTVTIHYFASALNQASIALHEKLGFREIARGISVPGVTFTGGVGVLFRLTRSE